MKKFFHFLNIFLVTLFLSACSLGSSDAEKIYEHLERAVTLEEVFEQQQKPLVELETKEQKLYEEIIPLGMSEFDKIKTLSNEAIGLVEQRRDRIQKEKESIDAAKEEFKLVQPIIAGMEEGELKNKANELYDIMSTRYEAYDELYNGYMNSLDLDKELYVMFQNEDLTLDKLEEQIEKINTSYEEVNAANESFNESTDKYNQVKKDFYQLAELKVVFDGEASEKNNK